MTRLLQRRVRDRYAVAALAYLAYGVVYLVGAVIELSPERRVTFWGFVPWWAFYLAGALLAVGLPYLIWRRLRWLTLVLCLGPAGKAVWLAYQQGKALGAAHVYNWFFLLVALAAALLLLRAALPRTEARLA